MAADIDFLDDYILKVTPSHPDEWEYDRDCVGEIEDFRDRAADAIEAEEARWLESINNPDHLIIRKICRSLNPLRLYCKQCIILTVNL